MLSGRINCLTGQKTVHDFRQRLNCYFEYQKIAYKCLNFHEINEAIDVLFLEWINESILAVKDLCFIF